jgi:hypothetical protein
VYVVHGGSPPPISGRLLGARIGVADTVIVDPSTWIAVISVIVAVIAAGVWAARQYGTRRRKLLFEWSAAPLIPETGGTRRHVWR